MSEKAIWRETSAWISMMIVWMREHVMLLFRSIVWLLQRSRRWRNHPLGDQEQYIYTSPEIISGKFSGGLTIGVIPMHLCMRAHILSSTPRFVLHARINKINKQSS